MKPKRKPLLRRLLPWLIAAAVIAALVIFVFVPIYTPRQTSVSDAPILHAYTGDGEPLTLENESLLLTLDPATTQFTLTQKSTGHVWRSNPENAENDPVALTADKNRLQATLMLTYSTANGVETIFDNYAYSVANGVYNVTAEDGAIRVDYCIGKVNKTFVIPTAITAERLDAFMEKLDKSGKRKLKDAYRLYDINKLKKTDDREALLATYPELVNQNLYVLRDGTAEHKKKTLEGYFADMGYTQEDLALDAQLVAGGSDEERAIFNVTMRYRLEGDDLIVDVPYDELRCNNSFPIINITPLPNFGAAGTDEQGFTLVPDGGGALIDYNNGKLSQNSYYANLYGWDYARVRDVAINETRCAFPVFGMTGGDSSFLCVLEGVPSFAAVQADISGHGNSYNTASAKYIVLHGDQYNVSSKTTNLVYMYEETIPEGCISQRYRFLASGSYVDMALAYRDYLTAKYPSLQAVERDTPPVSVELVGAIDKTLQKAGVPVSTPVAMTTFAQASEITQSLVQSGVQALSVRMAGWLNGGMLQRVLTSAHIVGELGGEQALKQYLKDAATLGVTVYLDGETNFAYDSGLGNGFVAFRDAARFTTREKAEMEAFSGVFFTQMRWKDSFFLVKPDYARRAAQTLLNAADKYGAGASFRDVGKLLSADYNNTGRVTREQSRDMQVTLLRDASDGGAKLMILAGNDYAVPYADMIADMDLDGGRYSILDHAVPFYQIALHGLKDYTGKAINLSGDWTDELLRSAEYGAGLSFTFFAGDAGNLWMSEYSRYFGSQYDAWSERALAIIRRYQTEMRGLNSRRIVGHRFLTDLVTVTEYENGARVYVNYGKDCLF